MTDYQEQLAECQANNKNLFASVGEAGKGFGALHAEIGRASCRERV